MMPKVAIVGRPNVGKSSLLNLLAGRRVSIVDAQPGVTRDRISHPIELPPADRGGDPRWCELIDTGGYGVYSGDESLSPLTEEIESQIAVALREARLILFLVDARSGLVALDEEFAKLLRRRVGDATPIVLVANKVDDEKYAADAMEAMTLGFGEPILISAKTGVGKFDLTEAIAERLDFEVGAPAEASSELLVAIVGKRNAGKSTFVNALAGSERVIVSEMPGTTRDSVDARFEIDGHAFTAIDTAGVRKRKSVQDDIEYYSLHRTLRSIRRADVVLFLIDATGPISQVDKKLSRQIQKHFKPCVLVLNKWDLVEEKLVPEDYLDHVTQQLKGLDFAPMVFASAKNNDHVHETVDTARQLHEQAGDRVSTGKLNQVMREILERRGPSSRLGRQAKIYYVTMVGVHPPTIALFVNYPELFDDRYQRYIINRFREMLPYEEVPIRLLIRARKRPARDEAPVAEG